MDSFDYATVIHQYKILKPAYEQLAECLQEQLKSLCQAAGITPTISGRAKSLESFADKICREGKQYNDPVAEITDLCGVRIIVHTLDEVEALTASIQSSFIIDETNSGDKQALLDLNEFGYLSRHFIVRPGEITGIESCTQGDLRSLKNPRAEIQLRTMAQHVWADIFHELGYKNEFSLPARWQREFARLAATLEDCDEAFVAIKRSMTTYESNYGAYLSQDDLKRLVERLEILAKEDPDNISVLQRLIRSYSALDGKLEDIEHLNVTHAEILQKNAPALRDIGVVKCREYPPGSEKFREGLEYIEKAVELAPTDVDALSSLGGALRRASKPEASLDCYRRAHQIDPSNPYPLLNYIAGEITRTGDVALVQNFYATMEMAKNRCQKQIEVKINLPWSYFDMGQILLFLGNVDESISWVAKAIEQSASSWMIRSAHKPIMAIQSVTNKLDGCGLIGLLLDVAEKAKRVLENEYEVDETNKELFPDGPILILAGGCSYMEDGHEEQLRLLADVLTDYQGTIVSGGTNVGIPGVVGQVGGNNKPYTIGYLPSPEMSGLQEFIDNRYDTLRYTKADEFSLAVALQFWDDFLESGRQPTTLKLIGFNGGNISAAEYRVALALGAQVGIVNGSGRAADALLQDSLWLDHPGLHVLEPDVASLTNFLNNVPLKKLIS